MSSYYSSKNSLYTYLIVSIFASIIFAFINPTMTCFLPMIFLLSPVTDNIKHEKDSKWMYYISTLPSGRKAYVNGYFSFYGIYYCDCFIFHSFLWCHFRKSWLYNGYIKPINYGQYLPICWYLCISWLINFNRFVHCIIKYFQKTRTIICKKLVPCLKI